MAEIAGTIPPVKERPKVAKRPTIAAAPQVRASAAAVKTAATPDTSKSESGKSSKRSAATITGAGPDRFKTAKPRTVTAPTMPSVKERPKVTRQSTILAASASPAKKTLRASPALPGAAETDAHPTGAKAEKSAASKGLRWTSWLPIAAGIAISSVAPQLFAMAGHWNPWGQRILFPLVQLTGLHEIGMSDELTRTMPQLMLYLQFPLEGLLVASNLRRGQDLSRAVGPVPGLHFVCALVLWIVALGSLPLI